MISKCVNPDCEMSFDYWRGRFFHLRKNHPEGVEPTNAHFVQHFWLCERCFGIYALECRSRVGVVIAMGTKQIYPKIIDVR